MNRNAVFLIHTTDRKGLLSEISTFFYRNDINIIHCQQYTDELENRYFMRVKIDISTLEITRRELERRFDALAATLKFDYTVHYAEPTLRMAILVSKTSHCLYDLLVHQQDGDLACEIPVIAGNHPDLEAVADKFQVPFYCYPAEGNGNKQQEARLIELFDRHHIDLVVLARYMQVLSGDFIRHFHDNVINIHHAFLPAFQGANPYVRAWERGVKMIGATAHYATSDLDEGPIIEQDVERVTHENTPDSLRRIGKEIERRVLSRAVKAHLEHRIIRSGLRTVVFNG